jgi:hypothetical protein
MSGRAAARGLAGLGCGEEPTVRLGVEVVGLLRFRRERQARLWQQRRTHLAPLPHAGLLFGDPPPSVGCPCVTSAQPKGTPLLFPDNKGGPLAGARFPTGWVPAS